MKPTQVMIVEDEALVGIDIKDNLTNYGYQVVGISNSGESALENAVKTKPEVILMDIQLKGDMNGIDTAKQIKQFLDVPIIYLTAYADDKTLTKALETSPFGYLLKPFVPKELHTTIQTALQKKNKEQIEYQENLEKLLGNFTFKQTTNSRTPTIFPIGQIAVNLGYTEDEIIRMGNLIYPLLIHYEDFPVIESHYQRLFLGKGKVSEIEFRLKHKTGIFRYFSVRSILSEMENYILHSFKDITWSKNLEYKSHISREKFVAISNNPYFGIAVLDIDGNVLNLNPTLEHLTGYSKEDLNSLNFSKYFGLKDLRGICQNFAKLKSGDLLTFETEAFIYTKNKGAFWGYLVFNAIYDPDKNLDRIICTLVDISESKLFEKKPIQNK